MEEQLVETWRIHARILLFLLAGVSDEGLASTHAPRQKTVIAHFAHVHNVRLMWLKAANPALLEGLVKFDDAGKTPPTRDELVIALEASADAIATLLTDAFAHQNGRIKGFKPHACAFVGYLVAHESYHIGKIDQTLRIAGHPTDDKTHYGLFEWGVR